jgi:energy-coupling factor transporter transmembrane protein EcfT
MNLPAPVCPLGMVDNPISPRTQRTLLGHVPAVSPLYQFHPLARLVALFFFGTIPLFIFTPDVNIVLVLFTLAIMRWGRVDLARLRTYLPLVFTVALFMFTVVILAPGHDPTYVPIKLGGHTVYFQPLFFAFGAYCRLLAMLCGTILYFATNRERDLLVALRSLRLPFVASYVLGLSIRSAAMFIEDLRTIREGEKARGLDTRVLSVSAHLKLYTMYLVPLFAIALRRADDISRGLFARGFCIAGSPAGTRRSDFIRAKYTVRARDVIAIAAMTTIFAATSIAQLAYGEFRVTHSALNALLRSLLHIPPYRG